MLRRVLFFRCESLVLNFVEFMFRSGAYLGIYQNSKYYILESFSIVQVNQLLKLVALENINREIYASKSEKKMKN